MKVSNLKQLLLAGCVLCCATSTYAAPEISVDSADVDKGIIREGSQKSIKHSFKITNTGNENLKISKVRPSCGCTAVGYDTVIAPGKTGTATAEVNLANFKSGVLRKYITLYSNAKKKPELSLSLGCTIRSDISIDPSYIRMLADKTGKINQTFTVTSNKKDLEIKEVTFIENEKASTTNAVWQSNLPMVFSHEFVRKDTTLADGFTEYKLDVSMTMLEKSSMYGRVTFKTNYPGKEEVVLSGVIEPAQK